MEREDDDENSRKRRNIIVRKKEVKKVEKRDEDPIIRLAYHVAGSGVSSSLLPKK
jgi:hypothetical protein